jgi:two-component system response regulator CpxR
MLESERKLCNQPLKKLIAARIELNFLNHTVFFLEELVITTGLEFNLLALLMNNAGTLVTREHIAEEIFQRKLIDCDKSINSHMANLRKKLVAISSDRVINTMKGQGYIILTS